MTEFYKAIRPNGASFNSPSFYWNTEPGGITRHPAHPRSTGKRRWMDAEHYLSVSTEPGACVGMSWPARLLIVEPVEGVDVWTPRAADLPHKRASVAWRTVREQDPVALLGPNSAQVVAFLALLPNLSDAAWDAARGAAWHVAWGAAWDAAWHVAWDAAWDAALDAARDAALDAAQAAAWAAARDAALDAARDAAWDAALALVVRDLVAADQFATLTAPMRAAGVDFDRMEIVR